MAIKKGFTSFVQFSSIVTTMKIPVFLHLPNTAPSVTKYGSFTGDGPNDFDTDPSDVATNQQNLALMLGAPGTLSNFYFWAAAPPGVTGSAVVTVMKNGVATPITATFTSGATGFPVLISDLVHSVHGNSTDLFSIQIQNNALSSVTITGTGVFQFEPD